ncbi:MULTISPECIES: hypothetical protein [unclassified Acinetobacter]|uniref:hypothetical protein n=1 Tax=unclassified Acinetobacter TaxID=196816 RepID=UPI0015D269CE|nr:MULTISPECIES: hypothetical protein [unclassified Acinetobacter]
MSTYYIKKNGLYLQIEQVRYESDYWEIEEINVETKTQYSWTDKEDKAMSWMFYGDADTYLVKLNRHSFFKDAKVVKE